MSIYLSLAGLIYSILLAAFFFKKKKIESKELSIYKTLIITTILSLCAELIIPITLKTGNMIIEEISMKTYLVLILSWTAIFATYVFAISESNINNKIKNLKSKQLIKKIYVLINVIIGIIIFLLPIHFHSSGSNAYSYGISVDFLFLISAIYSILIIFMVATDLKNIKKKGYIPVVVLLIFILLAAIIQKINPSILIINFAYALTIYIMYHTVENPDVKMLEEVSIAKESAEKANNAKTDFLSNMSHEIRTPLNAIVGFSESLKEDNLSQESKDKVNYIITASNNLLEIVNGILDISKIEANKLEIINKEYDVRSLLDELVSLTKARIGDKELDFRVNIDQSIPSVLYGDNTRLKQIILNLLTNAVKYTKEGFVDFTVSTVIKDNVCRLIISVEDSGIGIKEENLSKLFSKFERLDVEKQITIEGTGLGLAITEKLVELMNGKIVVQSVFGKGSKFTVSIDQRIVAIEKPEQEKPAKAEAKVVNANGAKILLVDDNELNIKVASVLLKKYNFNIDSCTSGLACIAKINNGEQYDIIFMDDMMPRMSGRETLQKLKSNPDFKIPIIALTANAITGMKEEYLKCGFDDYLSKPIEKLELERVIKKYVNKLNSSSINTNLYNSPKSIIKDNLTIELPVLNNEKEQQDNLNNKKILLVDDNELNIKVAQTTLKKYNFDITSVTSGSSCIEKVIDNKYDLILLDDMMPELDGCTTLDNLKTLENFHTPVVMMTASSYDEVEEKIKKHGFDGYLAKPINKEELDKVLENLLN